MTKHTKGNGTEDTSGVFAVTPSNMGKGIKWNASTNTYEVAIAPNQPIHINDRNELEVQISKTADNQLRVMKDGLYFGSSARPELHTLHVDAINGIDQNPLKVTGAGTRSNPLKTFAYALRLVETSSTSYIALHEDQEHLFDISESQSKSKVTLTVYGYGPKYDAYTAAHGGNSFLVNLDSVRGTYAPKLVFKGYRTINYRPNTKWYDRIELHIVNFKDSDVAFHGVHLVNDLGFTATVSSDPAFNHATESPNYVTHASRMRFSGNSVVSTICCRMSQRGTPSLSGSLSTDASNTWIKFLQFQQSFNGKWNSSFFFSNEALNIRFRELYGIDTLGCYILGSNGWDPKISTNVIVSTQGGVSHSALTSRIFNYTVGTQSPSGDKVILAPTSNIPANEWANYS